MQSILIVALMVLSGCAAEIANDTAPGFDGFDAGAELPELPPEMAGAPAVEAPHAGAPAPTQPAAGGSAPAGGSGGSGGSVAPIAGAAGAAPAGGSGGSAGGSVAGAAGAPAMPVQPVKFCKVLPGQRYSGQTLGCDDASASLFPFLSVRWDEQDTSLPHTSYGCDSLTAHPCETGDPCTLEDSRSGQPDQEGVCL